MSSASQVRIAPSLLSADFAHLARDIALVEKAGADILHLDIMDGHFVPNLSFGVPVVEAISRCTDLLLDTHLMIKDPMKYARPFVEAGAGSITFHVEVAEQPREVIRHIRELGVKVGLALNPGTPAEAILPLIPEVDIVLVMTVWPGFGGQKFMPECIEKVDIISRHLSQSQWLEVDGGIGLETVPLVAAAGANTFVAGNAIFRAADPAAALPSIRQAAEKAARRSVEQSA